MPLSFRGMVTTSAVLVVVEIWESVGGNQRQEAAFINGISELNEC